MNIRSVFLMLGLSEQNLEALHNVMNNGMLSGESVYYLSRNPLMISYEFPCGVVTMDRRRTFGTISIDLDNIQKTSHSGNRVTYEKTRVKVEFGDILCEGTLGELMEICQPLVCWKNYNGQNK